MGQATPIPTDLKQRPFTLAEARSAGIRRPRLFGKSWRRLTSELYCWHEWAEEPWGLLSAWQRLLPGETSFSGGSAAWLWSVGFQPTNPVEVAVAPNSGVRPRRGLSVRRCALAFNEVATVRGLRATTLLRTLRDLCLRKRPVDALISLDMAIATRQATSTSLRQYSESQRGRPGAARLRELGALAEPAQSPMETRLRWELLRAGLPRPEVQIDLCDADGQFVARADLYYPAARLVIEYDGSNHRDRVVDDDRRQNRLVHAGYRLLRFTAGDVDRPQMAASLVRTALQHRTV